MQNFSSGLFNSFNNCCLFESVNRFSVLTKSKSVNNYQSFSSPIATSSPIKKTKQSTKPASKLKILNINCRSICNKVTEFECLIDSTGADIVIGTESWLDNSILSSEIFPKNMTIFRKDRTSGRGGGVFITVSDLINLNLMQIVRYCGLN